MTSSDGQSTTPSRGQMPEDPNSDLEKSAPTVMIKLDIEHAIVADDPRKWTNPRKYVIVGLISTAAMIAGLGANIYNPAISQIESDLHASPSQLSLTLSLFILIQGGFPLVWSAVSEIQGRKAVYLVSLAVCTLGCVVAALSKTIQVLIGMRCLQAMGSSAVVSIGAATLADLYEPAQRGTIMGLYYCAPLLGPALGPIIGGALTQRFNWRATFWFLVIFTGCCCVAFIFLKDTFRRERSVTYQSVLRRVLEQQAAKKAQAFRLSQDTTVAVIAPQPEKKTRDNNATTQDLETQNVITEKDVLPVPEVRLSLKDVNPVKPFIGVLSRLNNFTILFASGLLFAFNYSITYTASRTLANQYHYDALKTGLVLLAYGIGCLLGSIGGGRYSDMVFKASKAKNEGKSYPEMRLASTAHSMLFFPPAAIGYGWVCEQDVHIAAVCVMLFLAGFFQICIYSSTLAYIVDANVGRSSSAVACNSCFRGVFAFVATEVAVPLQDAIGDGGLYTLWGGLLIISELLILLVWWKGESWRERAVARETRRAESR
ncbi:MFS general substrate transporter [Amylocystis lapponica]|nr:MFS general substrate transporter [Amylocystis lapponica]